MGRADGGPGVFGKTSLKHLGTEWKSSSSMSYGLKSIQGIFFWLELAIMLRLRSMSV